MDKKTQINKDKLSSWANSLKTKKAILDIVKKSNKTIQEIKKDCKVDPCKLEEEFTL